MRVKMLESAPGSPDGVTVNEYDEGKVYEVTQDLGDVFVEQGYATLVLPGSADDTPDVAPEPEPDGVDTENLTKQAAGPEENK